MSPTYHNIGKLQDEIDRLNNKIKETNLKYAELQDECKKAKELPRISNQNIEKFVATLLQNKSVNLQYLPDKAESKIYTNILIILLGVIQESLNDVNIEFMGHSIKMNIQPKKE